MLVADAAYGRRHQPVEHHEFVIQTGRTAPPAAKLTHQISWRVDNLKALWDYHRRLKAEGTPIQQVVTRGNAFGIYFFDPEGNRNEVYWPTGVHVPQPFRKTFDIDQGPEDVLAEAARLLADDGPADPPVQ
jgi:hypothetical protein